MLASIDPGLVPPSQREALIRSQVLSETPSSAAASPLEAPQLSMSRTTAFVAAPVRRRRSPSAAKVCRPEEAIGRSREMTLSIASSDAVISIIWCVGQQIVAGPGSSRRYQAYGRVRQSRLRPARPWLKGRFPYGTTLCNVHCEEWRSLAVTGRAGIVSLRAKAAIGAVAASAQNATLDRDCASSRI